MHSDITLDILDHQTTILGSELRNFQKKTCGAFDTYELRRETDARHRRAVKKRTSGSSGRAKKVFNLQTYKLHSLGDYVATIRMIGTTDSYSTEPVSRMRRHLKLVPDHRNRESSNIVAPKAAINGHQKNNTTNSLHGLNAGGSESSAYAKT
jgi:hypothetical protein